MLSSRDLTSVARARLQDAKTLLASRRYDGAAYLCGYAVEVALKARIVKTLKWSGFPESSSEFSGLLSFRSHDLDILLRLSGWAPKIQTRFLAKWSDVRQWSPESRYARPGHVTQAQAQRMVDAAAELVGALI